jgi:hypothetical protein
MIDYFVIYGETIFQILSLGQPSITIPKFKSFGRLIGIPERKMMNIVKEIGLKEEGMSYEEFEMAYYMAFEDSENPLEKPQMNSAFPSKKDHKVAICKNNCNIF